MNVALDKDCCSWRASSQDGRLLYLSSEENAAYRIPQAWCWHPDSFKRISIPRAARYHPVKNAAAAIDNRRSGCLCSYQSAYPLAALRGLRWFGLDDSDMPRSRDRDRHSTARGDRSLMPNQHPGRGSADCRFTASLFFGMVAWL